MIEILNQVFVPSPGSFVLEEFPSSIVNTLKKIPEWSKSYYFATNFFFLIPHMLLNNSENEIRYFIDSENEYIHVLNRKDF